MCYPSKEELNKMKRDMFNKISCPEVDIELYKEMVRFMYNLLHNMSRDGADSYDRERSAKDLLCELKEFLIDNENNA